MIYGFDCDERKAATAALLVYAVWRSRDRARFKVTPEVWGQVERFVKASAKRSTNIPRFIESLKPRLCCATLTPRAMQVAMEGYPPFVQTEDGDWVRTAMGGERQFLTQIVSQVSERAVIGLLYQETAWIVLLVRDRLERERPNEARIVRDVEMIEEGMELSS